MRCILTLLLFCTSMPTMAADRLTDDQVREFYKQSSDVVLKGGDQEIAFYETHVHDDARLTINTTAFIKGAKPKEETSTYDKPSLIKKTRDAHKNTKIKSLNHTVLHVKLSRDGRSAKVKDTSYGTSIVNLIMDEGVLVVRNEESKMCNGEVVLGNNGLIQLKNKTCNVEVTKETIKKHKMKLSPITK